MRQAETPRNDEPQPRTAYVAELQCFLCGSTAGSVESDRNPPRPDGIWQPAGDAPRQVVSDWRQIRCPRCAGALFVESVEAVVHYDDAEQLRREVPRRGRPPKWLVQERLRKSEAADRRS